MSVSHTRDCGTVRALIVKALGELRVDSLIDRLGAGAHEGEEEENTGVQRRLLKVVGVVLDVAEGEALQAGRGEVKVDRSAHRLRAEEARQVRRVREELWTDRVGLGRWRATKSANDESLVSSPMATKMPPKNST